MFTQSQYDLYVKLTKFGVHYEIDVHRGDIGNSVYKKTMVLYLDIWKHINSESLNRHNYAQKLW